jgi:hypothetical protein
MEYPEVGYPQRKKGYDLFLSWFKLCNTHRRFILNNGGLNMRHGSARLKDAVIEEELHELYIKFIDKGVEYMGGNKSSVTDVSTPTE